MGNTEVKELKLERTGKYKDLVRDAQVLSDNNKHKCVIQSINGSHATYTTYKCLACGAQLDVYKATETGSIGFISNKQMFEKCEVAMATSAMRA